MSKSLNWFIPGPTQVRQEVLQAMSQQVVGHRSSEYSALQNRVSGRAKRLFQTEQSVFFSTSSASGLWEAAILSCIKKKGLHLVSGAFSQRWYQNSQSLGKEVDQVELEWGQAFTPDLVREALQQGDYDTVFITHNETSTGVFCPLEEIAQVIREESDALIVVDAVSSLAGAPLYFDQWQLDVCLVSVQKCLAIPPGFSMAAVSDRALGRASEIQNRGMYFDFLTMKKYHDKHNTLSTPSIPHLYALDVQLEYILEKEGLEQRWQRHAQMQQVTQQWAARLGLEYLPEKTYQSPTVSCIQNTHGWNIGELILQVKEETGFIFGNGYKQLAEKTFRIGHMGDHIVEEVEALLQAIEVKRRKYEV